MIITTSRLCGDPPPNHPRTDAEVAARNERLVRTRRITLPNERGAGQARDSWVRRGGW